MRIRLLVVIMVVISFSSVLFGDALKIGSAAPKLDGLKWIKNGPVKLADGKGKNIYIVEFWATWCPPCRESIPHLSNLQKEYKDKGVIVVGISEEGEADVVPFVKKQKNMDYNVAVDPNGETYKKYMDGIAGIPHAFIINSSGIVMWSGHPIEIDSVLKKIIDATFDLDKYKKTITLKDEIKKALQVNDKKTVFKKTEELLSVSPDSIDFLQNVVRSFLMKRDAAGAISFLDKIIEINPKASSPYLQKIKINIMLGRGLKHNDLDNKLKPLVSKYVKLFYNDYTSLNELAWILVAESSFPYCQLESAFKAAKQAVRLSSSGKDIDMQSACLDTLARCYYVIGKIDKAIVEQEKAVNLLPEGEFKRELKEVLEFYKKTKELGKGN